MKIIEIVKDMPKEWKMALAQKAKSAVDNYEQILINHVHIS